MNLLQWCIIMSQRPLPVEQRWWGARVGLKSSHASALVYIFGSIVYLGILTRPSGYLIHDCLYLWHKRCQANRFKAWIWGSILLFARLSGSFSWVVAQLQLLNQIGSTILGKHCCLCQQRSRVHGTAGGGGSINSPSADSRKTSPVGWFWLERRWNPISAWSDLSVLHRILVAQWKNYSLDLFFPSNDTVFFTPSNFN